MFRNLYNSYLSLALPWRRHILAGTDLTNQTTYWIFRIPGSPKARRIAIPYMPRPFSRIGFAHVHPSKLEGMDIPPQWVQWLKYVRDDAPTLIELQEDVGRRERMKVLVAAVEEKWKQGGVKVIGEGHRQGIRKLETGVDSGEQIEAARVVVTQEDVLGQKPTPPPSQKEEGDTESPWKQTSQTQDEPVPWTPKTSRRT
jgi:NADH dehydrogenase [ubiquinone] 1 alpha subcomplex assembly factor 2